MLQNWSQEKNCFQLIMQKVLWNVNSQQKWLRCFSILNAMFHQFLVRWEQAHQSDIITCPWKHLKPKHCLSLYWPSLHSAISIWKGVIKSLLMDMAICFLFCFSPYLKKFKGWFSLLLPGKMLRVLRWDCIILMIYINSYQLLLSLCDSQSVCLLSSLCDSQICLSS